MNFLTGFTSGLLLITLSEIGDKTFFIGAILASRHPRQWVFVGVSIALFSMTILSVWIGQVTVFFPKFYVKAIAVFLFIGFGVKLIYDGYQMSGAETLEKEHSMALETVENQETMISIWSAKSVIIEAFTLTFLAEWGDRTQLATITLTSSQHPYGVMLGAILGHLICAILAVSCGQLIAGRISEKTITWVGGILLIGFGLLTAVT